MITADVESVDEGRVRRVTLARNGTPLIFREAIDGWCRDPEFRGSFMSLLAGAPFEAYFWETPCVSSASADRPFEFVLVDSPSLAGLSQDPRPFEARFAEASSGSSVCSFSSLGRDAELVAPLPGGVDSDYAHLAAFSREAPLEQQHQLWMEVGRVVERIASLRPAWVSTSGLGVAWVHVRVDSRPKYYTFDPYREPR